MALSTATITYDLSDYGLADFDSRRTKVWATNNVNGPVIDTEGNTIHLGSATGTFESDGTGAITVPTPGTGSNPASWQTTIHVDYPDRHADRGRGRLTLGPFTITVSANLADLVTQAEIPPETLGGDAWLAAIDADDMSQYRQQQDARLSATIEAQVEPLTATVDRLPDYDFRLRHYAPHLDKWKTALAALRAGTRDAKILCIGDSTTTGIGGSTYLTTYPQAKSYPHFMADLLDTTLAPAANGLQVPKAQSASMPVDTRWVRTGDWIVGAIAEVGFGGKGMSYQASGTAGQMTFADPRIVADTFDVYYVGNISVAGTLQIQATGGSAVTVATGSKASKGIHKVTCTAGSASASNVLTMTRTAATAGTVYIVGVEPHLSTTRKIRVGNAGASGSNSTGWVAYPFGDSGNMWNGIDCIKAYQPDLTIIDLGKNDASTAIATPVATYLANIAQLITAAQVSGDVILKTMIPSDLSKESEYVAALRALNLPVLDIRTRLVDYTTTNARGLMADTLHGNDAMYEMEGRYVAAILASATADLGADPTALPDYAGARTKSWDKDLSLYNGESQTLRTIRAKVRAGMAGTTACRVACVGDSKTFGSGIAVGTYTGKDSYPAQLRDLLGGYNSFIVANGSDFRWTSIVNAGAVPANRNDITFSTGGGSVLFTSDTPHTGYKLYGYLSAGGNVNVSTDGAPADVWAVTGGSPWRTFTKTGLADTTHSVAISAPANFALRGIELTYASGLKLFIDNHGRQSSTWSHWNDRSAFITYGTSTFDAVTSGLPDVCLVNLGTNTPTADADFDTLLDYIVTTKGIPTMLLVPGGLGGLAAESTYDARRDRIYDNADRLDLPVLDLGRVIGNYTEANAGSLMGDTVHENKAGYRLEARAIASAIAYA